MINNGSLCYLSMLTDATPLQPTYLTISLKCSVQSSGMYSQEPHLCLSPAGNSLLCSCSVTSFLHSLCLIFMSHADVRKILFFFRTSTILTLSSL